MCFCVFSPIVSIWTCFGVRQAILFPRIAVKSCPGAVVVRETEKVLDEKVTTRTEEVPCPLTGKPHLRTVEVVEKIIETEVDSSVENEHLIHVGVCVCSRLLKLFLSRSEDRNDFTNISFLYY